MNNRRIEDVINDLHRRITDLENRLSPVEITIEPQRDFLGDFSSIIEKAHEQAFKHGYNYISRIYVSNAIYDRLHQEMDQQRTIYLVGTPISSKNSLDDNAIRIELVDTYNDLFMTYERIIEL